MMHDTILTAVWLAAWFGLVHPAPSPADEFKIQGTSRVLIHVGKAGAFGFAGHAHEVEAPVTGHVAVDPADHTRSEVVVEFASGSLRVTGAGEPAQDVAEVQRVMLSDRVLDATRYPKIVFRSRKITTSGSEPSDSLTVTGDLSLHGVTKPCVLRVRVTLQEGSLTAEGSATLKQTDFGIQPVRAAGGTVRVKDELEITFVIRAGR